MACSAPPRLELRDVRLAYGGRTVLGIDRLCFGRAEVVAVLGPNGAGKSSLLHLLGFLTAPSAGVVLLDGRPVRGADLQARRRTSLLLQSPVLLDRSVLANAELGLRLRGVPSAERRRRSLDWLDRFGVAALAPRQARTLSGGETQRVALARALAFEPDIVLLDEPFTALDQPSRESLVDAAVAELRRLQATTVFVTHERQEAFRFADRAIVLIDGALRQHGDPYEIRQHPIDATVAAYIGAEAEPQPAHRAWASGLRDSR